MTIVGEGSGRDRLEKQAAAVSRGRVAFAGWRADVARTARGQRLCLPSSRWESYGYAALEAMAAERAVVASAVDGLEESGRRTAGRGCSSLAKTLGAGRSAGASCTQP